MLSKTFPAAAVAAKPAAAPKPSTVRPALLRTAVSETVLRSLRFYPFNDAVTTPPPGVDKEQATLYIVACRWVVWTRSQGKSMSLSMYALTVPVFRRYITNLDAVLAKAEESFAAGDFRWVATVVKTAISSGMRAKVDDLDAECLELTLA